MDRITGPLEFPVYIPTKGRPETQLTATALLALGIHPFLVVQEDEVEAYERANPECRVVAWPQRYMDEYEKTPELDPHPTTGAAHNFAWDHSRDAGYTHHWIMDDNIRGFMIRYQKRRAYVRDAKALTFNEIFIRKWQNLAGFSLAMAPFMRGKPIALNTRLYCATLYRNDLHEHGIKWRRGINDDSVVSLDILKTGYWCTAENRVVGIQKLGTSRGSRLPGGMTDFYAQGGFVRKSAELVRLHPDCATTVVRFNRIHHYMDFSKFTQQLIPVGQTRKPPKPKDPVPIMVPKPQRVANLTRTQRNETPASVTVGFEATERLALYPGTAVRYPIYIPSKGRADSINVTKLFAEADIPFRVVVEPQDADAYSEHFDKSELLILGENNQGIAYSRNSAKRHATEQGHLFSWQFDDDITAFRLRRNGKNVKVNPANVINLVETVTDLYTNIGAAAPMYDTWAFQAKKPLKINRMIASAFLLRSDNDVWFQPDIVDDIDVTLQYLTKGYSTLIYTRAMVSVPTTPTETGGMGAAARVGDVARQRCENTVKKWGAEHFKVINKKNWGGAPRLAPSRIWGTFPQVPILKTSA